MGNRAGERCKQRTKAVWKIRNSETDMAPDHAYLESPQTPVPVGRWAAQLQPVASSAAVWASALREFRVEKVDRIPLRARMLDVLEHLSHGTLLVLVGTTAPVLWLDGYPDIGLLAGVLLSYGYVEIAGRHPENVNVVYFRLSSEGARKLREGRDWWRSLSLWQRLKVRVCG